MTRRDEPDDKTRARMIALAVLIGGVCVWSPFWLFVQLHWHRRFVGPFYTFSLVMLPVVGLAPLGSLVNAKREHRWIFAAAMIATVILDLAFVPVLVAFGLG